MAAYRIAVRLVAAPLVLTAGLLAGCATEQQAETQQARGRTFYPTEYCWGIYAGRFDQSPDYWHIRRWCDQREMSDNWDL